MVMAQPITRSIAVVAGTALMIAAFNCRSAGDHKWTYAGATGPAKWGNLETGFADCKLGQFQSPIDIPDASTRKGDFPSILFNYKPSPLKLVDDGHTIRADYAPGSYFTIDGKRYELLQIDFHRPSEEKINGRGHEMDAHLVHRGEDGKLAVIAVLLDAGKENRLMKTLMSNLPKEKGKESAVDKATITAVDLLPDAKDYYRFAGSLTTPPCSEDVTWFVMKSPVPVSGDSIARFAKIYPMNARPIQPLNGRDIAATR
jgi:carbonic anhydrase